MATDLTSLVALVVAAVALLIAALQFTQQLMATGYVIRKCDQIVAGGLTRGGTRQWHWRQFRFTVKYEAITFTLPESVYSSLGVSSEIQVESSSENIWVRAAKLRRTRDYNQGCWVSFIQDILECLPPENVGVRWESADRVPDDLTVAPIRVDTITVMLLGVASGMSLSKFEPTTGEISMTGKYGGISSSVHPILGGLLHYTPSALKESGSGRNETLERHARAVRQKEGVWANAVFGRFNDRTLRQGYVRFSDLRSTKYPIVKAGGWPDRSTGDAYSDGIGGACAFMVFANVDIYVIAPPSSVNGGWSPRFAEVIVKAHLLQIKHAAKVSLPLEFIRARDAFVESYGCSSPHLPWYLLQYQAPSIAEPLNNPENLHYLAVSDLVAYAIEHGDPLYFTNPSSSIPPSAAYEAILRADYGIHTLQTRYPEVITYAEEAVARATATLRDVGRPSRGRAAGIIDKWPKTVEDACLEVCEKHDISSGEFNGLFSYVNLYILRAAYYAVMMLASGNVGPAFLDETVPDTALAYMA